MNDGWISLHRKIASNWVWEEKPFTNGQAWIDILLQCNHEKKIVKIGNEKIVCDIGESLNSLRTWAIRWGWDKSKVRRFLNKLKSETMIDTIMKRKTTHLRIINYDTYQNIKHKNETIMKRLPTPNNNNNKEHSRKFEELWKRYPNKDGKKQAKKHFLVSVKSEKDLEDINKALDNYLNSERIKNGYIKNGSTWFNNWQDWINWEEPEEERKLVF